jgi:AraC-like DNA-binding protein
MNFEFVNDKKNGNACVINKNGDITHFQYLNNIKHGKAETIFSNKSQNIFFKITNIENKLVLLKSINYEYINDIKHGKAFYTFENGDITHFEFNNNLTNLKKNCKRPLELLAEICIIKEKISRINY